ncbi:NAD-dependent epimerase/dehydratase family protein, partial [Candidatus Margulisiibacteriota bacterium]
MKKDIFLVTGGAGYIGSVLVNDLVKKGKKVRVFDKLYFGDSGLRGIKNKIDLIQGDVRQFPTAVLDGVTAVIHLGSLSNDPTAEFDPKANKEINYEGTMRVAEACIIKGVKRMTFASSAAVIGFHVDSIADEKYKPNPQSEYSQSKLDAENGIKSLHSSKFSPVVIRQATVYGFSPRMRWDLVVNTMTKDAYSKKKIHVYCAGDNWRPLVHVKDVVRAHLACLQAPEKKVAGQIFNLVDKNYRILELGHWVKEILKDFIEVEVEVLFGNKESRS